VEHFKNPFSASDLATASAVENHHFFSEMLSKARRHPFYSHPFIRAVHVEPSPTTASFVVGSYYKIVSPFTAHLCALSARAPHLRSRFALIDNIYEEMGCGDLDAAHPSLYAKMLASIGISIEAAENAPTLPSMRRTNDHLREVIWQNPFSVGCALLASVEATISPSFPLMALVGRRAFPAMDMEFFDRHGPRDEEHCGDAAVLFALTADSADFAAVEAAVQRDLDHRTETLDDWLHALETGAVPFRIGRDASVRPRPVSVRPRPLTARPGYTSQRPRADSARPSAERDSVPPVA
jgi:pyrroloquinoline quinone (PQQ) biosynthesis protein C